MASEAIWQPIEGGDFTEDLPVWRDLAAEAGGPILDVGAGYGRVTTDLIAQGHVVLACDIVIASDNAVFGLPEPLVGAIALGGGLHRLPRQIGLKPALGIILTGRKVAAAEGKTLGFVNEVVSQAELAAAIERWTADILRCSSVAIQASKEILYRGLGEPSVADAMRHQRDYEGFRAWLESEDVREGPRAFAQKRPPSWTDPPSRDENAGDQPSKP